MLLNWRGKKVCFLGDSITEGVGVTNDTAFWNLLSNTAGILSYSYGKNGARFRNLAEQAKKMYEEHETEVDAIFLFAGTNDFNGNTPLGEWWTESEKTVFKRLNDETHQSKETRKYREFDFDTATFKGSINTVLAFLKENYYDKQIVLLTPIHRAFATFGDGNVQYDEMHSNGIGRFFDEYVAAIKEAASIWSCELIDLNAASGLFPLYDNSAEKYFCNTATDRLHPNASGHERLAETISSKLCGIRI